MSTVIASLERAQLRRVPSFQAGDKVKVHFQVIEGTRRRTQLFEGIVIKRQGHGARETFTVRKQSFGVGVERTFPVHSPKIERIEVSARGDVRRAKLYYLRDRVGKRARVRERRYTGPEEVVLGGLLYDPAAEAEAEAEARAAAEAATDEVVLAEDQAVAATDGPPAPTADAEPAPTADAEPAPTADAEPAPTVDAEPAPTVDAEPAPRADAEPAPPADAEPAPSGAVAGSEVAVSPPAGEPSAAAAADEPAPPATGGEAPVDDRV